MQAVFAGAPVPQQIGSGTDEAVIVESLYDGRAGLARGVVGGRGDEGEGVVEVDDLGFLRGHDAMDAAIPVAVPDGGAGQSELVELRHAIVGFRQPDDGVSGGFQQARFGGKDLILPTGLLVVIVNRQDFHPGFSGKALTRRTEPWPACAGL